MKFFFTFFLLLNGILSFAQIQKGDWLIRGSGVTLNQTIGVSEFSDIEFDVALGYFINEQWMVGGGIGLKLTNNFTFVRNQIFGRYYFKDSLSRKRLYLEGRWEKGDFALIEVGQGDRRFTSRSYSIGLGVDFFLSENLALETQVDYFFYNWDDRFEREKRLLSDRFSANMKLQYFFRYRDFRKERLIDYRNVLTKGKWFLGGSVDLKKSDRSRINFIQDIRPAFGVFLKKNWAVGGELVYTATFLYENINVGLNPFSRYYLNVGRKKKLFAELKVGYNLGLRKGNIRYEKFHVLQYGGAIGLSNFINEDVSFDISYSFFRSQLYRTFLGDKSSIMVSGSGLKLGIQYFFTRKKS